MPRAKTAVHTLIEGGFLVRGTTDPTEALRLAIESGEVYDLDEATEDISPRDYPSNPHAAEAREEVARYLTRLLDPKNHRAGWFRISPCGANCGEHGWHWDDTPTGPGRGNFQGVIFE
jgi:hypothetical protein